MVDKVSYSIQHIGLNLSTTLFHSSGKSLFIFRTTSLICTCGIQVTGARHLQKIVIIMTYVVRGLLTIFNILQSLTTLSQGQLAPHLGTQTASLADFFTSEPVLSHSPTPTMQSTTASTWRGLSEEQRKLVWMQFGLTVEVDMALSSSFTRSSTCQVIILVYIKNEFLHFFR